MRDALGPGDKGPAVKKQKSNKEANNDISINYHGTTAGSVPICQRKCFKKRLRQDVSHTPLMISSSLLQKMTFLLPEAREVASPAMLTPHSTISPCKAEQLPLSL